MWYYTVIFIVAALHGGGTSPTTMPTQAYDTIIIGLGSAGTTAASTLCKAGKRVLALEAQNRIGGRVNTVQFGDGVVEVGAEWIHGTDRSPVYKLALANNISVMPQNLDFDVYRSDGSLADKAIVHDLINFSLKVVDDPPENPEPLGDFITRRLMAHIETKYPELLNNKDFIEEFLKFMDLIIDNYEGSTSWNDVTTHTQYDELGGEQHMSWHRYGYKTFFEILLNTYNNGPGYPNLDIKLNTEVTQITWPQDPNEDVVVTCKDGATYRARNVIVTVSLGVLKERHTSLFSPKLSAEKIKIIDSIQMGIIGKIMLSFEENWWSKNKDDVYNFLWSEKEIREMGVNNWILNIVDVTSPMGSNNVLTVWTGGATTKHATLFSPKLPKDKVATIEKMTIGVMDKIILSFAETWWPLNETFFGFIWNVKDRKKVDKKDEWTTKIFGASRPLGCKNALTLWTSGESAKLVETLPEDEVKRKAMDVIRKFMGKNRTIPEPTGMIRSTWFSNPFTRGSYTYDSVQAVNYPNARVVLAEPLVDSSGNPRVLFAGEATDRTHFSTVHGASDSGLREANRLLPHAKL